MSKLSRDGIFPYFCLALACLALGVFLHFGQTNLFYNQTILKVIGLAPFPSVELEAQSAIVYDPTNEKVLFNKDADEPRPLASLTKVMTALVASDLLGPGDEVNMKRIINRPLATSTATTTTGIFATGTGDIPVSATTTDEETLTLTVNERWRAGDLRDVMLVSSSNQAADALAFEANARTGVDFVPAMNKKAGELGLTTVVFRNPSGLDLDANTAGADGSARDVARLFTYIFQNKLALFEVTKKPAITRATIDGAKHTAQNTDQALAQIPGLYFSKTGLTDLAGGNLAVTFDAGLGHPLIAVVLGSSEQGRFTDMVKLVNASVKYLAEEK